MNCKEFEYNREYDPSRKIEDNCELNDHLANCSACRTEFDSISAIRRRIRLASLGAAEFQIDPAFNIGLESRLKAEFFASNVEKHRSKASWVRIFVPAIVILTLAFGLGVLLLSKTNTVEVANTYLSKGLSEIGTIVAGNHVYCTLERLGMWETLSHTDYPDKAKYTETVLAALKANYSEGVQLVSVHDCAFEGKDFRHIILRTGTEVVSVFVDKSDIVSSVEETLTSPIVSGIENGFQIASFRNNERLVFVVSKLSETDNLTIARTLSYSFGPI
ncbi:MAG: anti-sigma factor family protein [Pyrinomonadaceae bacterium]